METRRIINTHYVNSNNTVDGSDAVLNIINDRYIVDDVEIDKYKLDYNLGDLVIFEDLPVVIQDGRIYTPSVNIVSEGYMFTHCGIRIVYNSDEWGDIMVSIVDDELSVIHGALTLIRRYIDMLDRDNKLSYGEIDQFAPTMCNVKELMTLVDVPEYIENMYSDTYKCIKDALAKIEASKKIKN